MATARELREQRAGLIADAKALGEKDNATSEDIAKANEILARADGLLNQIKVLESTDTLMQDISASAARDSHRPATNAATIAFSAHRELQIADALANQGAKAKDLSREDQDYMRETLAREKRIIRAMGLGAFSRLSDDDRTHYAARFGDLMTGSQNPLGGDFQAAQSNTPDTAGGYTVAPLFETEMLIAMKLQGGMRAVSRVIQTSTGATLPWPTMDDTSVKATIITAENTDIGSATDLSFGRQSLSAYTYTTGVLPISRQLLQDSAFSFDTLIRDAFGGRFVRGENEHFTTGDGVNKPYGVVTKAASGTTGTTGQTGSVIYDDLVELEHSVDPVYRPGATWMMHDSSVKVVRKIKETTGAPLWNAGLTGGAPSSLMNYPIAINQDVATMAANAKSILFGNFSSYIIRDTLGMQIVVLNERYAEKLQVGYLAFKRTDGNLISAASPIKYYANSAS